MRYKTLVLALIIILSIMLFSQCAPVPMTMDRYYSTCPTYPQVKHYRQMNKKMNPKYCNFVR